MWRDVRGMWGEMGNDREAASDRGQQARDTESDWARTLRTRVDARPELTLAAASDELALVV